MNEKRYAVLIGNADYENDSGFIHLRCPLNDVDGWHSVLKDQDRGGFNEIVAIKDRFHHEIFSELHTIIEKLSREDLLFLYYSGHGMQNVAGDLYLAARNSRSKYLASTAVSMKSIRDLLHESPCNKIVLVLDCCFSGAAGSAFSKGDGNSELISACRARGTYLLTASTAVQTALEKDGDNYSVFTKYLIEGVATGAADDNGAGFITVDEMFQYARRAVIKESHQAPTISSFEVHDWVTIAKSGADPRAGRADRIKTALGRLPRGAQLPTSISSEILRIAGMSYEALSDKEAAVDEILSRYLKVEISPVECKKALLREFEIKSEDSKSRKWLQISIFGISILALSIAFMVIYPGYNRIDPPASTGSDTDFTSWKSYLSKSTSSIPVPSNFPLSLAFRNGDVAGKFAYDATKEVFVESTNNAKIPRYFFRPIKYEEDMLWVMDDSRGYVIKIPRTGGTSFISQNGTSRGFSPFYQTTVLDLPVKETSWDWDFGKDYFFGNQVVPGSPWRYGYLDQDGKFLRMPTLGIHDDISFQYVDKLVNGVNWGGFPSVGVNRENRPLGGRAEDGLENLFPRLMPHEGILHPGTEISESAAVVRWIAPVDGTYLIRCDFLALDCRSPKALVFVRNNEKEIGSKALKDHLDRFTLEKSLYLKSGTHIDFVVGNKSGDKAGFTNWVRVTASIKKL